MSYCAIAKKRKVHKPTLHNPNTCEQPLEAIHGIYI